ncbi:MAG: hypothetical protein Fur0044_09570 [Anaerolineae bacterium]
MNPGDTLAGHGLLLQQGRLIANVDYHLAIPRQTHFVIVPSDGLSGDYGAYLGGFILLTPADAAKIALAEYTLELADKTKKLIRIERRYKEINHRGEKRVSFWVKAIS